MEAFSMTPPPNGLNQQFMRFSSAVPNVERVAWKHRQLGLIGDRLCMEKIIVANGKSFTIVSVIVVGGLGVVIVRRLSMFVVRKMRMI